MNKITVDMWALDDFFNVPHTTEQFIIDEYECQPISPKVSEERKEELRQEMKGNTYRVGKKLSDAHKEAIRQANLNREYPKWSEESKARLSETLKGNNRRSIPIVWEGVEYPSMSAAAKAVGMSRSTFGRRYKERHL